jgi:hypothetical protein
MERRNYVKYFVNRVPLDRDGQNNKTDTFANLENIKSKVKEPTFLAWNKLKLAGKALA